MVTYSPSYQYNPYPQPTGGSNTAFGMVPGQIALPNPAGDLGNQITNLPWLNDSIFGNLYDQSRGIIPQSDVNYLTDQGAAAAVAGGMPGLSPGTFFGNRNARNLGLLSYLLQQQAAQQYPSLVGAVSQTQTVNPALQSQIAEQNALNAAAPNPQMAQSYAQKLYSDYLASARGPGGGTSGITGPGGGSWWDRPENQSSTVNYPAMGVFGATGAAAEYPGYTWNTASRTYEPNANAWWLNPSTATGVTGGSPSGGGSYYAGADPYAGMSDQDFWMDTVGGGINQPINYGGDGMVGGLTDEEYYDYFDY